MKTTIVLLLTCLATFTTAANALPETVSPGDDHETVIAVMGHPEGSIIMGSRIWLTYARGTVKLEDGIVTEADLISEEAALARQERERIAREQIARQRTLRIAEGKEIKGNALANPSFHELSAESRAAFWRDFIVRYPEVPASLEYAAASQEYAREQEELARRLADDERIRELERRLQIAERNDRRTTVTYRTVPNIIYWPTVVCDTTPAPQPSCTPVSVTRQTVPARSHTYRNFNPGFSLAARLAF